MKRIFLNYIEMDINLIKQIQSIFKPLVTILLKYGVSYKVFDKIAKEVFVSVATNDYGIRGRDANTSKVAFMTGLSRREISKIKQKIQREEFIISKSLSYSEKVMDVWLNDKDFTNSSNQPKAIIYEGTGSSFVELIKKTKIDVTPKTAYLELLRLRLIVHNKKDQIILQRYELMSHSSKETFTAKLENIMDKK